MLRFEQPIDDLSEQQLTDYFAELVMPARQLRIGVTVSLLTPAVAIPRFTGQFVMKYLGNDLPASLQLH
jgi:hypothetical protein